MLVIVGAGQLSEAFRVEFSTVGEQLGPVLFGQFSAKRIDGDDEGSPVCLELQHKQKDEVRRSGPEDTSHGSSHERLCLKYR